MVEHRSTQPRVSNDIKDINFKAGTALENLRDKVVDIEALAGAAAAVADKLPTPKTKRQRLVFGQQTVQTAIIAERSTP